MENKNKKKKNNNNNNSSNSLVFGRWPQTKINSAFLLHVAATILSQDVNFYDSEQKNCLQLTKNYFVEYQEPKS